MPQKCLIIGAIMLDIRAFLEKIPFAGDDVEIWEQTMELGGCAYNVFDIMQHFHAECDLCAPIGKGYYADIVSKLLIKNGKKSILSTTQGDNGYCLCLIDRTGERTFFTLSGVETKFKFQWFSHIDPKNYDYVYICGYELEGKSGEEIVRYLESHQNWKLFYAPGPRICNISENIQNRIFSLKPVIHLNEKEAIAYTGYDDPESAAKYLYQKTRNAVIITLGEKGAYLYEHGNGKKVVSHSVKAVDTTGAGDSHIGTIIAALLQGKSLEEAVVLANKVAAIVVQIPGAVLTKEQFNKNMEIGRE